MAAGVCFLLPAKYGFVKTLYNQICAVSIPDGVNVDSKPLVFLNYAKEDEGKVKPLRSRLSRLGVEPWMYTVDVLAGEKDELAASAAIKGCAFFLVCLTKSWVGNGGVHQAHFKQGLDKWQEHLEGDIFLIPVLLEKESTVPEKLAGLRTVNYFEKDGWANLSHALISTRNRRREEERNSRRKKIEQPARHLRWPASSNWPPVSLIQAIVGEQEESAARCSVMVGSGLSETAGYPGWSEFSSELTKLLEPGRTRNYIAQMRDLARNDPLGFISLVKRQEEPSYYRLVEQLFGQEGKRLYSNLHRYLLDTDFHCYLTTNIDCCLENAARERGPLENAARERDPLSEEGVYYYPDYIELKAIQDRHGAICHLHGFLYRYDQYWKELSRRPDQIVLASDEFFNLYSFPPATKSDLKRDAVALLDSVFQEGTLLFVGYSLGDPVWHKLLDRFDGLVGIAGQARRNPHYALMPLTSEVVLPKIQRDYLLNRYGIEVEFFPSSVDRKGRIDFSGLEEPLKQLKERTLKYRLKNRK